MRILFLSWRDLAHPQAGGSEFVVDRLARGMRERGHETALLAGGPVAPRSYPIVSAGSTYGQYLRMPIEYHRRFRDADLVVDVENGIPYFSPLWRRGPVLGLVHHVHTEQWGMYFPAPVAAVGRFLEGRAMPAVYRRGPFVAVSPSTATLLEGLGVGADRIRVIEMGCDPPPFVEAAAPEPTFLALGRLVPHKRVDLLLRLWERVRPVTGGTLVIAGDGPERAALERQAGDGVEFTGLVSDEEKYRRFGRAWILLQTAAHEGWGTTVMEAAAVGTPTLAFNVLGLRDSIVDGTTGRLVADEDEFVATWQELGADAGARGRLGDGARAWAAEHSWDHAVDAFQNVADEAVASHRS